MNIIQYKNNCDYQSSYQDKIPISSDFIFSYSQHYDDYANVDSKMNYLIYQIQTNQTTINRWVIHFSTFPYKGEWVVPCISSLQFIDNRETGTIDCIAYSRACHTTRGLIYDKAYISKKHHEFSRSIGDVPGTVKWIIGIETSDD